MDDLQALYQDLILDHAKHPHGRGEPGEPSSHQRNPVCGDEVILHADLDDGVVRAITWTGDGCSISQASASMLTSLVEEEGGMPVADARERIAAFREALRSRGAVTLEEDVFGDASALSGVSKYTARVKCAMLAWVALEDVLARSPDR
ncbi:Fe-S cluster assembly sulfur transfer protein SufU [Microbacterium sp.]|uniref:Fe-S cluster assembly sulfur transfer protein SufU n=1 Tax=Microbacterium sp. TaxID=51671 RepID=UPI0037C74EFD